MRYTIRWVLTKHRLVRLKKEDTTKWFWDKDEVIDKLIAQFLSIIRRIESLRAKYVLDEFITQNYKDVLRLPP